VTVVGAPFVPSIVVCLYCLQFLKTAWWSPTVTGYSPCQKFDATQVCCSAAARVSCLLGGFAAASATAVNWTRQLYWPILACLSATAFAGWNDYRTSPYHSSRWSSACSASNGPGRLWFGVAAGLDLMRVWSTGFGTLLSLPVGGRCRDCSGVFRRVLWRVSSQRS
jgi:hypothetical protein